MAALLTYSEADMGFRVSVSRDCHQIEFLKSASVTLVAARYRPYIEAGYVIGIECAGPGENSVWRFASLSAENIETLNSLKYFQKAEAIYQIARSVSRDVPFLP